MYTGADLWGRRVDGQIEGEGVSSGLQGNPVTASLEQPAGDYAGEKEVGRLGGNRRQDHFRSLRADEESDF